MRLDQESILCFKQTGRGIWMAIEGQKAVLGIQRKQISLSPSLACTAHAAQGQTRKAVIADVVIGRGVKSISSYVAITRIRNRRDLMIYRPFQLEPFTLGIPQGTALLLKKLRGEQLDWTEIENNLIKKQTCVICNKRADKSKFDNNEFKRKDGSAVCAECKEDCK